MKRIVMVCTLFFTSLSSPAMHITPSIDEKVGMNGRQNLLVIYSMQLEKTLKFYQMLGMIFKEERHENGPFHFSSSNQDHVFEIYPGFFDRCSNSGFLIGFEVDNLEAVIHQLVESELAEEITHSGENTFVKDPEGRRVLLRERQKIPI